MAVDVKFNDYIRPLRLVAHGSDFPAGTSSRIIGWGQTAHGVNLAYPGTIQTMSVKIHCIFTHLILDLFFCLMFGDSGGPMMSEYCTKWVQSGISSWSFKCSPNTPGVYTRVSHYEKWIKDTIKNQQDFPQFVNCEAAEQETTGSSSTQTDRQAQTVRDRESQEPEREPGSEKGKEEGTRLDREESESQDEALVGDFSAVARLVH
ncbi:unnamed protein product [Leuciscus chuanchicus]